MARLRRQTGLIQASINIPDRPSAGRAIVKLSQSVGDRAFKAGEAQRIEEANLAAQALVFERNEEGNLVAPTMPVGDNGLVAPNIFSQQYTNMVGTRFLQQTKIDASASLNKIAVDHRLDPEGFQAVAEAYIEAITELAPEAVRGDVNTAAQETAVSHFNFIIRKRAEHDFNESVRVHENTGNDIFRSLSGFAENGADESIVIDEYAKLIAHIADGTSFNYNDAGQAALQIEEVDRRLGLAFMAGEITSLPNNAEANSVAVDRYVRFMEGAGTIKQIEFNKDGEGRIVEVDVSEAYPDQAERRVIAEAAIAMIQTKEAARSDRQGDRFDGQSNEFYTWYLPHVIDKTRRGELIDLGQMQSWFDQAERSENHPLKKAITNLMLQAWNQNAGDSGTRAQRRAAAAMADHQITYNRLANQFLEDNDLDSFESLSDEQMKAADDAFWRGTGSLDIRQGPEMAEDLDGLYDTMTRMQVDIRTSSLEDIERWIDGGAGRVGVITWGLSVPLNAMLSSENEEEIDRALSVARMLYNNKNTQQNMTDESALGAINGEALAYIFDNYAPSAIKASLVTDLLDKFGNGWRPHKEWSALSIDDRNTIVIEMEKELDGFFTSVFPTGFEVQSFNFKPFTPTLGSVPAEMQEQIFHEIRNRAGLIDPQRSDTYRRHISEAIQTVANQHGWVPSNLGWSESRFTEDNPATFAFSQFAPEAFYRDPEGNTDRNVMNQVKADFQTHLNLLNKDDTSLPKLIAGENAFLEYNAGQSITLPDGRHVPAYNIRMLDKNQNGQVATSDRFTYGDQFAINFELAFQSGNKITLQEFRDKQEKKARQRLMQQEQRRNITTSRAFQ